MTEWTEADLTRIINQPGYGIEGDWKNPEDIKPHILAHPESVDHLYHEFAEHREMMLDESTVQISVVRWYRGLAYYYPDLESLFSVPNGGKRHKRTAKIMKAEGIESGVPDILSPKPKGKYNGLAIEMKVKKNTPTEDQVKWLNWLAGWSWFSCVCWSKRDAQLVINEYYGLKLADFQF